MVTFLVFITGSMTFPSLPPRSIMVSALHPAAAK